MGTYQGERFLKKGDFMKFGFSARCPGCVCVACRIPWAEDVTTVRVPSGVVHPKMGHAHHL